MRRRINITRKQLKLLFSSYSIISIACSLLFIQYFMQNDPNLLAEQNMLNKGRSIANLILVASTYSKSFPKIDAQYLVNQDSGNLDNYYVSVYDNKLQLISQSKDILGNTLFTSQYNERCGAKYIAKSLIACVSNTNQDTMNAYVPIVLNNQFKGLVYLEREIDHMQDTILNVLQHLFFILLILPALVLAYLVTSMDKKINTAVNVVSNIVSDDSEKEAEGSAHGPTWLANLVEPLENKIKYLHTQSEYFKANVVDRERQLVELEQLLNSSSINTKLIIDEKTMRLAQASHDIRSPLHAILALCEIMLPGTSDKNTKLKITSIYECAMEIKREVDNILVYEARELDKIEVSLERINIEKEVESIVQQLGLQYSSERPVMVYCSIDHDVPFYLFTYKVAIIKILTNLASNARKYTDKGHVTIRVSFKARTEQNGKLIIIIEDTGRGMPQEQVKSFGTKFKQYHQDSSSGGVGLGLKIVKDYLERINGTINVESQVGVGTRIIVSIDVDVDKNVTQPTQLYHPLTLISDNPVLSIAFEDRLIRHNVEVINKVSFEELDSLTLPQASMFFANIEDVEQFIRLKTFLESNSVITKGIIVSYLDVVIEDETLQNQYVVSQVHTPLKQLLDSANTPFTKIKCLEHDFGHLRIMSVDNEVRNLKIIEQYLSETNIHITSEVNPMRAIELAEQEKFDLIIMDVFMPEMQGYDVATIIRSGSVNSATPIVAATATVSSLEKDKILSSGMNEILIKPFNRQKIIAIVSKYDYLLTHNDYPTSDEALDLTVAIKERILNLRGIGDLDIREELIWQTEQLTTLLIHLDDKEISHKGQNLFIELKRAYYYSSVPIESVMERLDHFMGEIEIKLSLGKRS